MSVSLRSPGPGQLLPAIQAGRRSVAVPATPVTREPVGPREEVHVAHPELPQCVGATLVDLRAIAEKHPTWMAVDFLDRETTGARGVARHVRGNELGMRGEARGDFSGSEE